MSLRKDLIRLAYKNPALRPHILPLVKTSAMTWLGKVLTKGEAELKALAQRYTGESKHTTAKIDADARGVTIRLWLQLEPGEDRGVAQDLADTLIGRGSAVGTHKLVPDLWVAVKKIQ